MLNNDYDLLIGGIRDKDEVYISPVNNNSINKKINIKVFKEYYDSIKKDIQDILYNIRSYTIAPLNSKEEWNKMNNLLYYKIITFTVSEELYAYLQLNELLDS